MRELSKVESLERGYSGTAKTIERMHRLVAEAKLDPTVQNIATWIRLQVPQDRRGHGKETADAIFQWVRRNGIFKPDPFQIEQITSLLASAKPVMDAKRAGAYKGPAIFTGDCDTYSMWISALGGVLGFQYAFETVKVDSARPDEFSHVYAALRVGNDWYPLDPSTPSASPGWRPNVSADQLKRWPEGRIEDVVGVGMSGSNGHGLGNGHAPDEASDYGTDYGPQDGVFPESEYGYGIPRSFGPGNKPGRIPTTLPGDVEQLAPSQPAIPRADLERGTTYIKAGQPLNPSARVQRIAGQPDDHGPPYRRKPGIRQPYIKVEGLPYPPGSYWNKNLGQDVRRFWKAGPYIQGQNPGTPERQVRIVMEQPMPIRRRSVSVLRRPVRHPAGMGQLEPRASIQSPTDPAKTAETASKSVWDTITDTIKAAIPAASGAVVARTQARYAGKLAKATNTVAGQEVVTSDTYTRPAGPWYTSPWALIGAAVTIGGVAYVTLKSRSGGRRRRR